MPLFRRKQTAVREPGFDAVPPNLIDLFAPPALDFQRASLTLGERAGKVLLVYEYPPKVPMAWLARLFSMPGVVGSMHLTPADPSLLVKRITASITEFGARLQGGTRNALVIQRTEQSLRDAQELLRKIDQEQQQVFAVVVVLLVLGRDAKEVEQRARRVEAAAAAAGMRVRAAIFLQQEGLAAAGPWAWLPPRLAPIAPRSMPSETVAGAFPFVGGSVNHGRGILLGRDDRAGLVLFDRWTPPEEAGITNPNMAVLATSGAGKSFAVKLMLLREYMLGCKVVILDPEREYRHLCQSLGGSWVNAAGGGGRINPFQFRPEPEDDQTGTAAEDPTQAWVSSPLAAHLQRLRTFFALYLRDLTDLDRANLEEAILDLYREFDITWDTRPEEVGRWPNTRDLYQFLKARAEVDPERWQRLALLLRAAGEGADAALWGGSSSVPPTADFIVLDVHDLQHADDATRRAQYFNVLTYAWDLIRHDRSERKMLVVDEAWILADPRVPQALDFLRDMSKRIRKYSGSITIISQNVVDFLAPEVARQGEAVLGNASLKLLLRQGEKDLEVVPRLLSLSEAEKDLLSRAKRGEGLLVAGNQRVHVFIEAAPHEMPLLEPSLEADARAEVAP